MAKATTPSRKSPARKKPARKKRARPEGKQRRVIRKIFAEALARDPSAIANGLLVEPLCFCTDDIMAAAKMLRVHIRSQHDVTYAFRHRRLLPSPISECAPPGMRVVIQSHSRKTKAFELMKESDLAILTPTRALPITILTDSRPDWVKERLTNHEQALLASLLHVGAIQAVTGIDCWHAEAHDRTQVPELGQVEIDDLYFGSQDGVQYVLPVQAKGMRDPMSVLQLRNDALFCRCFHPDLTCRMIGVKQTANYIALFVCELSPSDTVSICSETHLLLQ